MAWLRIDDGFMDNAKVAKLSDRDLRVWMRVLCWAARQRSGHIPPEARQLVPGLDRRRLARYSQLGLLDETEGEHDIHDWAIYNPPRYDASRLQERVKDALDRFPAASNNEIAAIVGGRRKDTLAAVNRFREPPSTGSGNHPDAEPPLVPGTDREPPAADEPGGSGNRAGTGSRAPARARQAHSRARTARPVPQEQDQEQPRAVPVASDPARDEPPLAPLNGAGNLDPHAELPRARERAT